MSELVLVGILVPFGILAATAFLNSRKARRERIREVARGYGELCHGSRRLNCGPHAFLQAGARELRSDKEVRSALASIVDRWGPEPHPLGNDWRDLPDDIDLKSLVDQLSDNADNFGEICTKLVASRGRSRGVRARIKKVLAWAPAGEGLRRVAVLVGFAGVLLWAVEWLGNANEYETPLHTLIANQPRAADEVQIEREICEGWDSPVDRLRCEFSIETTERDDVAWGITHLVILLLLAPAVWLLAWLAAQATFGTLAWVVHGFRRRR